MAAATETVFVSTTPGLEAALRLEAAALGRVREVEGGVEISGATGLHLEACLRLRVANQVLLRIFQGEASDQALRRIDIAKYGAISVEGSSKAVEAAAKRAWRTSESGEGTRVLLRADGNRLTVSVDCAGELLFRRGYRQEVSRAPMRETLAAGMLMMAGYDGAEPLWDPMCGSGTLVIEAAWIAQRRAPGAMRSFAFESWKGFDASLWAAKKSAAASSERPLPAPVRGSDLNAGSLGVARRNAKRADVADAVTLERLDALELSPPEGMAPGWIVSNLPYGKRVGGDADLVALHRAFGEVLQARFKGWRALLLTGGDEDADALELPVTRTWDVDNGGLHCVLILTSAL